MLTALRDYLLSRGYENICCDFMPDVSKDVWVISITKRDYTVG